MRIRQLACVMTVIVITSFQNVQAGPLQASGQAMGHSVNAVGYSVAASAQLVFGAAAIPLGFSAQVGKASGAASDALWEAANEPVGQPLPITEENITAGPPPSQVIEQQEGSQ